MKAQFRKIFSLILNIFEQGSEPYAYKPLNRKILIFMGILFSGLIILVLYFLPEGIGFSFLIPVGVFGGLALVTLVVGLLGTDRAVAKIWGDR